MVVKSWCSLITWRIWSEKETRSWHVPWHRPYHDHLFLACLSARSHGFLRSQMTMKSAWFSYFVQCTISNSVSQHSIQHLQTLDCPLHSVYVLTVTSNSDVHWSWNAAGFNLSTHVFLMTLKIFIVRLAVSADSWCGGKVVLGTLTALNKCGGRVRPHFRCVRLYNIEPSPLLLSDYVISQEVLIASSFQVCSSEHKGQVNENPSEFQEPPPPNTQRSYLFCKSYFTIHVQYIGVIWAAKIFTSTKGWRRMHSYHNFNIPLSSYSV